MASRDLVNNIGVVQLLAPANAAASPLTALKSSILDTAGFEAVALLVQVGTLTGVDANNKLVFTMEESDTTKDTDFTSVSATANSLAGTASGSADFGDQARPMSTNYPTGLLPSGGTPLTLYTGLLPINSSTQANMPFRVGYLGNKRYIRLKGAFTGSPSVVNLDVIGLLGHPLFAPLTSPAAIVAT